MNTISALKMGSNIIVITVFDVITTLTTAGSERVLFTMQFYAHLGKFCQKIPIGFSPFVYNDDYIFLGYQTFTTN